VQHHLLLPETATRRDLCDPRPSRNVADAVGTVSTLELLDALTKADSRATGPSAWSNWKRSLLEQLVVATAQVIRDGSAPTATPPLSADLSRLAALTAGDGAIHFEHVEGEGVDLLRIASRDRAGLFSHIAGVLAMHGLDVVGASAATGADGVAIDEFRIARVPGIELDWRRVEHDLDRVLSGAVDIEARLEQRLKQTRRRVTAALPARLEVLVSNDASDSTTVVEVRAPDAPGVLYRLAHALTLQGLDIRSAVVATLGHEVVDAFYVTSAKSPSGKLPEGDFEGVRAALRAALAG